MRVFIFGAGRYGREIAEKLINDGVVKIEGFLDNYSKDSCLICEDRLCLPIFKPDILKDVHFD